MKQDSVLTTGGGRHRPRARHCGHRHALDKEQPQGPSTLCAHRVPALEKHPSAMHFLEQLQPVRISSES
jgi:hypothetical protein